MMDLGVVSALLRAVTKNLGVLKNGPEVGSSGVFPDVLTYESRFGMISNRPMIVCRDQYKQGVGSLIINRERRKVMLKQMTSTLVPYMRVLIDNGQMTL